MSSARHPALQTDLQGMLALDASAGTGKTYSIALLFVRKVLEGVPIERILVSTFTNDAAAELRERLRSQLNAARAILTGPDCADPNLSALVHEVTAGHDAATRRLRLEQALSDFDLAPICTIHSFCQQLLRKYSLELGVDPEAEVANEDPLVARLVEDFIAQQTQHKQETLSADQARSYRDLARQFRQLGLTTPDSVKARHEHRLTAFNKRYESLRETLKDVWAKERETILDDLLAIAGDGLTKTKIANSIKAFDAYSARQEAPDELDWDKLRREMNKDGFKRLSMEELVKWVDAGSANPFFEQYRSPVLIDQLRELVESRSTILSSPNFDQLLAYLGERLHSSTLTFADLIQAVFRQLDDEDFVEAVRRDYDVILVDESQDTDAQQIVIFRKLFADPDFLAQAPHCLVWVGDPKQSIYRFRGADLDTYLRAKEGALELTLDTNFRSDPPLIAAVNALFEGPREDASPFGEAIPFTPVQASKSIRIRTISDGEVVVPPALTLHTWSVSDEPPTKSTIHPRVLADCVQQIQALLATPHEIERDGTWRRVRPGDIAILARNHTELESLRHLLLKAGIPAAYQTDASVYLSDEARDLSLLLDACVTPRASAVRAALTTPLFGFAVDEVARTQDAADLIPYTQRFGACAQRIEREGIMAVLFSLLRDPPVHREDECALARLAGLPDGERIITNLIQLGELLQQVWLEEHARSAAALKDYLDHAIAQARDQQRGTEEEAALRLETDRAAVTLSTVHAAKGLQYPIVLLPTMWLERADQKKMKRYIIQHQPDGSMQFFLPGDPGWDDALEHENRSLRAEYMRLLYVALTRAEHQLHVWWGRALPSKTYYVNSTTCAFAQLLFARPVGAKECSDTDCREAFEAAMQRNADATYALRDIAEPVATDSAPTASQTEPAPDDPSTLRAVEWQRGTLPIAPLQSSYSALIRQHAAEYALHDDEMDSEELELDVDGEDTLADNGIFESYQAGRLLGDRVHHAFEVAFNAADVKSGQHAFVTALRRDLPALVKPGLSTAPDVAATSVDLWRHAAGAQLDADFCLGDLLAQPHAAEWTYLLPHRPELTVDALADVLAHHGGDTPWGEPGYIERIRRLGFEPLTGYFEGIVDLLSRTPDGRWLIVDYKTNHLSGGYASSLLHAEMAQAHYLLQALLYTVAVHRWLRRTVSDWNYTRDFAGAAYLFLRGLQADTANGVWNARPGEALVRALEELLCGREKP